MQCDVQLPTGSGNQRGRLTIDLPADAPASETVDRHADDAAPVDRDQSRPEPRQESPGPRDVRVA